jgi:NAD(P)-dependent dehydrogenase (short-subunit alcohol dehydrogenase family)
VDGLKQFDLTGKVAIVTGGSRGLGRAICRGFAAAGADVVITSRKLDACESLSSEIVKATGRRALPFACHVGEWDDCSRLVDAAYEQFGKVDVLINNAGMSPGYESVADITEAYFDKVMDVNLKGPFRLMQLVGARMADQGGGSIINMGSRGAVLNPRPHMLPYSGAKAGLEAITIGFAHAFGPSVRVNAILVGPFLTDVSTHWNMERMTAKLQRHALGRAGQPEEVVGAAIYLASDAASFTSGALLAVDGGEQ